MGRFDRVDLLVNNARIFTAKPFIDHTAADYEALVATNLVGFVHMTQEALRLMVRQRPRFGGSSRWSRSPSAPRSQFQLPGNLTAPAPSTVESDPGFEQQLAGHVETGNDSMTDPLLGRV